EGRVVGRQQPTRRQGQDNSVWQRNLVNSADERLEGRIAGCSDDDDLQRLAAQFGVVEKCREREKIACELSGECLDDGFGPASIAFFAGQRRQPQKHPDHRTVPGGDGGIGGSLAAGYQSSSVACSKEISTCRRVPIVAVEN